MASRSGAVIWKIKRMTMENGKTLQVQSTLLGRKTCFPLLFEEVLHVA